GFAVRAASEARIVVFRLFRAVVRGGFGTGGEQGDRDAGKERDKNLPGFHGVRKSVEKIRRHFADLSGAYEVALIRAEVELVRSIESTGRWSASSNAPIARCTPA